MARHVAFLRGINLGERRVKMDRLRGHFEAMGLDDVATFIASGNVIFEHEGSDLARLEREIEGHLEEALGFAAATFVRSLAELDELTGLDRVSDAVDAGFTPYVTFLRRPSGQAVEEALDALEGPDDRFHVRGREVLWFRRGRLTDSPISTAELEEIVGKGENTRRKLNTVRRIVSKFGRDGGDAR